MQGMETRDLLVVDAFADELLSGVGVPVLPDGSSLTDAQLRAVADELGAPGTVTRRDGEMRHVPRVGHGAPVAAAVAGSIGLSERDALEPGTQTLTHAGGEQETVDLDADRTATVAADQTVETAAVDGADAAAALNLPTEAVEDVGLPVGRADGAGGSLLVPVMFLESLGELSPAPGAVADLLGDAERLFAYSFDTLAAETDIHARVFEPAAGGERAASGVGAAGCAQYLAARSAFDGEKECVRVESGQFRDRPATLDATLESGQVSGRALLGMAGTVNLPPDDDDDIIAV
jgi:trans-2,3-dihydro-3-hydroxyanthranilate isomerase